MGLQEDATETLRLEQAALEAEAAKGPSQVQADKTAELKAVYERARDNMAAAPEEYAEAQLAYFLSRDGESGTTSFYTTEARLLNASHRADFQKLVDEAKDSAATFKTVTTYAIKAQDEYVAQLKSYTGDLNEISLLQNEKNTSERKSYYLHKVGEETETWDGVLTVYIVALGLVYAYHVLYELGHYRSIPAWLGLLFIFLTSYLFPFLVAALLKIKPAMNIYTTWAQPSAIWTGSAIRYDPNAVKTGTVI
jgi:hypothetical protein